MPSLKDIRRRIASVKNTQKITKAMKMVSAAKLRRAEDAAKRSRPYAEQLDATLRQIVAGLGAEAHPLLASREVARTEWIVVTSDRGLCGGFNGNLLRLVDRELKARLSPELEITVWTVGKKARDYFARRAYSVRGESLGFSAAPSHADGSALARIAAERFTSGAVDEVMIVYNEFISAAVQKPKIERLLPLKSSIEGDETPVGPEPLFEPSPQEMLAVLLPRQVESRVYRALLESAAAEHAARMAAMESATSNASDMIGSLTLQFNKARQAAITKELMEIVSGAEALSSA